MHCKVAGKGIVSTTLCWLYDVLGELYLTCLSGLMGNKVDSHSSDPWSFPKSRHFSILVL